MHKLATLVVPLFLATPVLAADLGPYPEHDSYYERPAPPPVVERERIIERRYYEPAPVYERRVYVAPPTYIPSPAYADAYYYRPYAYAGWRPRHFFPRPYWHRRPHRW